MSHWSMAGLVLLVGSIQWLLVLLVLMEGSTLEYRPSVFYVSDLGDKDFVEHLGGPPAFIFNASLLSLGLLIVGAVYVLRSYDRPLASLLMIAGVGAVIAGAFPETIQPHHGIGAGLAFLFGGLSAIASCRVSPVPLRPIYLALGCLAVGGVLTFSLQGFLGLPRESTSTFLGLGKGGMERLIIYPTMLWLVSFGGLLSGALAPARRTTA